MSGEVLEKCVLFYVEVGAPVSEGSGVSGQVGEGEATDVEMQVRHSSHRQVYQSRSLVLIVRVSDVVDGVEFGAQLGDGRYESLGAREQNMTQNRQIPLFREFLRVLEFARRFSGAF